MKFKQKNLRICPDRGIFYYLENEGYNHYGTIISILPYKYKSYLGGMLPNYNRPTQEEILKYQKEIQFIKEQLQDPFIEIEIEKYKLTEKI